MVHHHDWSYSDLENMISWERSVHVMMTNLFVKEENERIQLEKQAARAANNKRR
jgi:hypothetical protein